MISDRIFGLVVTVVALAYIAGATQIQLSFLPDPLGARTFPYGVGAVMAICGVLMVLRPDPDPEWPGFTTFIALGFAVAVLVGYAYALKPLGFLIPTAIAAGVLSYQIHPRVHTAVLTGLGLSVGLYLTFKYVLGLGLVAFGRALIG